ncbi:MAG: NAD-dependent epimerase/dehydratase family protein [Bacteroidaceae bacterium]|nr:NAD-dependent epimerase/dehydratase family protein [Bacteroidaceae bacterium]
MAEVSAYKNDILQIFKEDLPWEKLSGRNILVTGATGLIGGCLVETLMMNPRKDYQVYASGRNEERAKERFKEFVEDGDFHFIRYDVLKPLVSDVSFDYIIHAASNASPNFFAKNSVEVIKSNIDGVANLMEYGLQHGMKRFLYVSSGEVYGEGDGRVFTEDYSGYVNCATPRACYPSSKRAAETLCVSYAAEYGADVVIARPCHVYGPHFTEQDNRVYAQFIRNVLRGEDIVMKSTGEQFRSWCYVVDCVSALLYILLKGESGEAYNIADANSNISIRELAEMIAEIGGRKVVIDVPDADERKGYNVVKKSVFATEKLERLGWQVQTIVLKGLKHSIELICER